MIERCFRSGVSKWWCRREIESSDQSKTVFFRKRVESFIEYTCVYLQTVQVCTSARSAERWACIWRFGRWIRLKLYLFSSNLSLMSSKSCNFFLARSETHLKAKLVESLRLVVSVFSTSVSLSGLGYYELNWNLYDCILSTIRERGTTRMSIFLAITL